MDLSKHMLFQSVRLVGAVGIEPNADHAKLLRVLFRSCGDVDLELRSGTAMYKSGPPNRTD
jgi:hypothetical protein